MRILINIVRMAAWFGVTVLIVMADQFSKRLVNTHLFYGEVLPLIPGCFNLTLIYNPGAAFSFLANAGGWQKYFFTLLACIVCGWLSWQMVNGRFSQRMNCAATFIIGGAIGNMIDRLMHGHVIDFIQFYYKSWYYPAFNLADSFICVGAALMVLDSMATGRGKQV